MQSAMPEIDVLLIEPPFTRLMGQHSVRFPLNLGYLAGALRDHWSVYIYNMEDPLSEGDEHLTTRAEQAAINYSQAFARSEKYKVALDAESQPAFREAEGVFSRYKPGIIGITCMSAKYPSALKVAQIYRSCVPDGIIIWGGQHPTIRTEQVLSSGLADVVVRGEGEETLTELVGHLKEVGLGNGLDKIRGISFRRNDSIIHTEERGLLPDIDSLGFPARDLLMKPIRNKAIYGAMITSRGCPFRCGYCSARAIWSRKVRYRSIPRVIEEIEMVKEQYGIRDFFLWDDCLTTGRTRTLELMSAIKKTKIRWACTTRVDIVDRQILKEMRQAGCVSIDYGIESGSDRMLKKIGKDTTRDQIADAIRDTADAGIIPNAFLMIGFPDETEEDIRSTIEFARTTKAWLLCLSVFTPYPGTPLFERAKELGLIGDDFDWTETSHQSSRNYFTQCVSREAFDSLLHELIGAVDAHNEFLGSRFRRATAWMTRNPKGFFRKSLSKLRGRT